MRAWLLLLLAGVASAQVKLEVQPGLHGRVKSHRWSFVTIDLTNGAEDTSGELQFTLHGDDFPYTRKVDLPAKKRARFNVYFHFRELQTEATVKWVPAKGDEQAQRVNLPGGNKDPYFSAAVWSSRPSVEDLGLGGFCSYTRLQTDDLPDHWKGYDALDVLVIDTPEASAVTPSQEKALHDWIEAGGHVIVVGDTTWTPGAVDPVIQKLLPCKVLGGTVDGVSADTIAGVVQNTGTTLSVLKVQPQFGVSDVNGNNPPLWLRELRGSGMVEFLTFHPRQVKDIWASRGGPLWGLKLYTSGALPKEDPPRKETESAVPILIEPTQQGAGGKIGWVTLFAFLYAVVVGPGVFWFQRRYRNVFTRALTFPAVVASFVVVAWMLNVVVKPRTLDSRRLNLVYCTQDGSKARGVSYLSFSSPYEGTFVFSSQRQGSLLAVLPRDTGAFGQTMGRFSDLKVEEGASHRINASVRPWIPETFLCEWKGEADPGVVSHLSIAKNKVISGSIENTGSTPLKRCRLVWNGRVHGPFEIKEKSQYDVGAALGHMIRTTMDDTSTEMYVLSGNPLVNEKLEKWEVDSLREGYSFYALQRRGTFPYANPKPGQSFLNPLIDQEWDAGLYTVMPQVDAGAVILLGWRAEDASRVEIEGRSLDAEAQTMYAVRLEVAGGR